MTFEQPGLLELREYPVNRGQADVHVIRQQHSVDILGGHMPLCAFLKQLENFQPGKSGFETHVLEALGVAHLFYIHKGLVPDAVVTSVMIYRFKADRETSGFPMLFQKIRYAPVVLLSAWLVACSSAPRIVTEYKIDIQQGNVLTQDMVSQLKPGQSRDQVRFILGTPLISDMFHQQRWDYAYTFTNGATGQSESRRLSVFFGADGLLERVAGDVAVADVATLTTPVAKTRVVDLGSIGEGEDAVPLPPPEEPGYYRRFMDLIGF
jgi:outer membrane protein assembly factor BamE